jgi:uncharacterized protein YjbI with pentapeptide repeats
MDIKVTGRSLGKVPGQKVTGELRDVRLGQKGGWLHFASADCERVDFSKGDFDFAAVNSTFVDCSFGGVKFRGTNYGSSRADARQTLFRRCSFDRATMLGLQSGDNARFEGCSFKGTRIAHWQADHCEFVECVFAGRISDVRFSGRPFDVERDHERNTRFYAQARAKHPTLPPYSELERRHNDFLRNDFRDAELDEVSFEYGIDIDGQMMPAGPQYLRLDRPRERILRARAIVARWPEDTLRERALFTLQLLSEPGKAE